MNKRDLDLSKITKSVVVVAAAGVGKRFGGEQPKQYQPLEGKMVLDITLDVFLTSDLVEKIVLLISPDDNRYENLLEIGNDKIIVIDGDQERQLSVHNGLRYLFDNGLPDETAVLVHDAVRPCLTQEDLKSLIDFFQRERQACFLAEVVTDSLKRIDLEGNVEKDIDRDQMVRALTPQLGRFSDLKTSLSKVIKNGLLVTDEVSALTDCDIPAKAIIAQYQNPKITHAKDLELVQQILASRRS